MGEWSADRPLHRANLKASHLILGCRSIDKGEKAKQLILESSPSQRPKIEVWPIDMTNYASVLAFGRRANENLSRLDAVILNAGVVQKDFELAEGIESTLTINVVSTFLLAQLILPKLHKSAEEQGGITHLTFVGSIIHLFAKDQQVRDAKEGEIFKKLSDPAHADMGNRYVLSKMMLTLGVRDLASRTDASLNGSSSRVVINDVNPGWCRTELFRNEDGGFGGRIGLRMIGRNGEVGARTITHAASAGEDTHGKFLSECQVKPESDFVRSEAGQQVQERLGTELRVLTDDIQASETK